MMSWPDASISIRGTVNSQEDLDALVAAIVADAPTLSWGEARIDEEDKALDVIRDALAEGGELLFAENEREDSSFLEIEAACRRIGLTYCLSVDVDESDSVPGSTEIWTQGLDKPLSFIGSSHSGGVLLDPKELLPFVESGDMEKIGRIVRLASDPEAGLPKSLVVGPGLAITAPAL